MKYICTKNAGARPGRDVVRGHVGHRRTRRTRFGRTRRGAGVTAGHCAAPASTRACRPWQVGRARWRESAGWRTTRGVPLAAGAAHVTGHALASPTRSSGLARSYLPQPTFQRAYKPVLAVPRAHACLPEPPPSAIAAARRASCSARFPRTPVSLSPSL
jgi:hypothetical protein